MKKKKKNKLKKFVNNSYSKVVNFGKKIIDKIDENKLLYKNFNINPLFYIVCFAIM
jgi:hypothetical protein